MFTPKNKRLYYVDGRHQKRCPNRKDRAVYMMMEGAMTFREAMKVKTILEKHPIKSRTLKTAINKIDEAIYISQRY